ncbi:TetR/AcrR family transcriptional regulator [Oceanirhabdus sp. W0125-5]|uniref:TetR/AcrR family transcriptional regulator n=1 Tax=Oceanirhabdus sp. W0125-5 TaxID=2999116 RepID=UPI0022F2F23E|nr:TetR/AcrR family transcriptional regulator [Oceanirhabdus sp. W0125-5]WBW94870.1 TetR/AcrR family transcriptional regulator [Oceanirhabdus sp. W0125-5]
MDITIDIRNEKKSKEKFYKSTFEKISKHRRDKILNVAISEFASKGYNATNINIIAKQAGISIGSMYSYFDSKESLFLTVVDECFYILEKALEEIDINEGDFFHTFEKLLRIAKDYAIEYPEINQIYLNITTQSLSSFADKLSFKLESITANLYCKAIKKARVDGIISTDIDEKVLSFCLDNLIIMFQFSFTSDYYKERMKVFLGRETLDDTEKVIEGILNFVKNALFIR